MTSVAIEYPGFTEHLGAEQVEPGVCRLTSFSEHMPLCPGDLVKVIAGAVIGVVRLQAVFVVEAYFRMGTSQETVDRKVAEWHRATLVQQSSGLTVLVSSTSMQWIDDTIRKDPLVELVESIRVPEEVFSFDKAVEDA